MISSPKNDWDAWFNVEVDPNPTDERFLVKRAHPRDFRRVQEVVDKAFGRKRSQELYEHWYDKHPFGLPKIWYVAEKASGQILKVGGSFPWPIWKGGEQLNGRYSGDAATLPAWQRKGLSRIRREVRERHPMHDTMCTISGPNRSSRIVTRRAGNGSDLLGAMRGGIFALRADAMGQKSSLRKVGAKLATASVSVTAAIVRSALGVAPDSDYRFESLSRFTSDFDALTLAGMQFEKFWCPHNAEFLNWRYIDYPTVTYRAFALYKGDDVVGYTVLRLNGSQIGLSEFVSVPKHAPQLLAHLARQAIEEGGSYISFFSTPSWPHWNLFYRFGMLPVPSNNHMDVSYAGDAEDAQNIKHWRLSPGDRDYH